MNIQTITSNIYLFLFTDPNKLYAHNGMNHNTTKSFYLL